MENRGSPSSGTNMFEKGEFEEFEIRSPDLAGLILANHEYLFFAPDWSINPIWIYRYSTDWADLSIISSCWLGINTMRPVGCCHRASHGKSIQGCDRSWTIRNGSDVWCFRFSTDTTSSSGTSGQRSHCYYVYCNLIYLNLNWNGHVLLFEVVFLEFTVPIELNRMENLK